MDSGQTAARGVIGYGSGREKRKIKHDFTKWDICKTIRV
jgi:hypothetical protein